MSHNTQDTHTHTLTRTCRSESVLRALTAHWHKRTNNEQQRLLTRTRAQSETECQPERSWPKVQAHNILATIQYVTDTWKCQTQQA